jgi:hypothetical protein
MFILTMPGAYVQQAISYLLWVKSFKQVGARLGRVKRRRFFHPENHILYGKLTLAL